MPKSIPTAICTALRMFVRPRDCQRYAGHLPGAGAGFCPVGEDPLAIGERLAELDSVYDRRHAGEPSGAFGKGYAAPMCIFSIWIPACLVTSRILLPVAFKFNGYRLSLPDQPDIGTDMDAAFLSQCDRWEG